MKISKETIQKIIQALQFILTVAAGFFGGSVTASAAQILCLY